MRARRVVPAKLLMTVAAMVAACALVARKWPKPGSRQGCALALAGLLLRAGWRVKDTRLFIRTAATAAGDEEAAKRAGAAASTNKRLTRGEERQDSA